MPGLADAAPLTSESLLELERIPVHLVVLGGGYVGVEFAQAMRRLGSRVTLVQRGPQLPAREDSDVAAAVAAILRADGVDVMLDTEVGAVERRPDGMVRVALRGGSGADELVADDILAALGRRPKTDGVNLNEAGGELDERGYIRVDERLRTTAAHTYAVGDVNGGRQFTHVSFDDHRGLLKVVIEDGTDRIVGAAVLAANGGEVMTAIQMAMLGGLTAGQVRDAVIAHPTMAEGLNTLLAG